MFTNLLTANRENQEASDIFHTKNYNEASSVYEQRSKSVVQSLRVNNAVVNKYIKTPQ